MVDILNAISDDKSLLLFNSIAISNGETDSQVKKNGNYFEAVLLKNGQVDKS